MEPQKNSRQMNSEAKFPTLFVDLILPYFTLHARHRMCALCKHWKDCIKQFQKNLDNEIEKTNKQSNTSILSLCEWKHGNISYYLFHKMDIFSKIFQLQRHWKTSSSYQQVMDHLR